MLKAAVAALSPGGRIFVGDVRSLPLLKAFHASVRCHRAGGATAKSQLRHLIDNDVELEDELVIDPAFFAALKDEDDRISDVEIFLKRGHSQNELTRFRYDALVHVGATHRASAPDAWLDWQQERLSLADLKGHLASNPRALGVRAIPNARLAVAVKALGWLASEKGPETLEGFKEAMASVTDDAVEPELLWSLAEKHGYALELCYSNTGSDARIDALFRKGDILVPGAVFWGQQASSPAKPWAAYANNPLKAKLMRDLTPRLRKSLPDYMMPRNFVILESLPLTPNGKVDRKALPAPDRSTGLETYVAPRTPTEENLAGIWAEILGFEKVGVENNFFDLGGNSMMTVRLISEINRRHQVSLGPAELFRNPTVGQMARLIDAQQPKRKRQPAVVQMQKGRAELPVYFIYAGPTEFRLAKSMGEEHAIFGIDAPWPLAWRNAVAANRTSAFPTMEQLVAPYAAALAAHAPSSPCVLAGHSFAGVMAFEAAHQFLRQGGKVEMVILLDTWAKDPAPEQVAWHQWRREWKQAPGQPSTDRPARSIALRLRNSWRITRWLLGREKFRVWSFFKRLRLNPDDLTAVLDEEGTPLPMGMLDRAYTKILDSYRPRLLESRGVLFRTEPVDSNAVLRGFDHSQGWNNLFSRGLEIVPVIGDHLSMIRQHYPILAREINEALQRHWSSLGNKVSIDAHERQRAPRAPQTGAIASVVCPDR